MFEVSAVNNGCNNEALLHCVSNTDLLHGVALVYYQSFNIHGLNQVSILDPARPERPGHIKLLNLRMCKFVDILLLFGVNYWMWTLDSV